MEQEIKTAGLMINLYCHDHHSGKDDLCPECLKLFDYVKKRLEKCPFKENHGNKPQSKLWGITPSAARDCSTYKFQRTSFLKFEFHNKPKCSKCTVHCYKPDMRKKIKEVMRYSGPRVLFRHPILTGKHYLMRNRI